MPIILFYDRRTQIWRYEVALPFTSVSSRLLIGIRLSGVQQHLTLSYTLYNIFFVSFCAVVVADFSCIKSVFLFQFLLKLIVSADLADDPHS